MSYTGKTPVDYVDIMESQSLVVLNDLTVDTNTLYVDSTNNRVGIGTSSPASALDVTGTVTADGLTVDGTALMGTTNELQFFTSAYGIRASTGLEIKTGDFTRFLQGTTERMRIDSSGNVGIGVVPSNNSLSNGIDSANGLGLFGYNDGFYLSGNAYYNGAWKYKTSGAASKINSNSTGDIFFSNAASGSQDGSITWSDNVTIDSSGNVGIGTSSPAAQLHVQNSSGNSTSILGQYGTGTRAEITAFANQVELRAYNGTNDVMTFKTGSSERMRIDSSGNVGIGTTTAGISNSLSTTIETSGYNNSRITVNHSSLGSSNGSYFMQFGYGGSMTGSISQSSTSSVAFNTTSDYRLKENLETMTGAIPRLKNLQPKRFSWITENESDANIDGFIAHEVQTVVPEAVTGEKDAVDADGNPEYQGIDQSKLVPLLTAALQEAITKIEDLEARLATLETN